MIDLYEIHALVDFGMCVILWLVQLVIYPSFLRIDDSQLICWHQTYVFRVSIIIIPLILAQLGFAAYAAITQGTVLDFSVLSLILLCWLLTFFVSVPLHRKISQGDQSMSTRQRLIATNWPRTILWTVVFLLGLLG